VSTPRNNAAPWIRVGLFGTPQQLNALLGAGLDPNSRTDHGTTLLMMAAADAEKVRLLLAHSADAKARAPSGCDALSVAAAYRDVAPSLRLLLDAGAETQVAKGTRARYSPLVLASMTGDLESVKLLLARGADPSVSTKANTPLAAAVTFGYADVVQELIEAGAVATLTESTGINLIHWAVITNHPSVIPVLVRAGARINAMDEFGFTPLMYAATIDFGDTRAAEALRKAGADPGVRNKEGRTAREQAGHFQHARLAAALR
jgi:ankyrin repeat protein